MKVKFIGPKDAPLTVIGESPGVEEVEEGEPFVGMVGRKLKRMFLNVGLPWKPHIRIGNVMESQPRMELKGHLLDIMCRQNASRLQKDIGESKVYLLVGNLATRCCLTFNMPSRYKSVIAHAAAIYNSGEARGLITFPHNSHIIAIRHPSALLRGEDQWYPSCKIGLERAAHLLQADEPTTNPAPPRTLKAGERHIKEVVEAAIDIGRYSLDIETPYDHSCIYLVGVHVGGRSYIFTDEAAKEVSTQLAESGAIFVGQNHSTFDIKILHERWGVPLPTIQRDTRWMDADLRPRMPHDLAHMAAHWIASAPGNWKPMTENEDNPYSSKNRLYCSIDTEMTDRVYLAQMAEYEREGIENLLYIKDSALPVISRCAIHGARIDQEERRRLRLSISATHDILGEKFNAALGEWAKERHSEHLAHLEEVEAEWGKWRGMAFSKKGESARAACGVSLEEATSRRDEVKVEVDKIRSLEKRYRKVRSTQKKILTEFLFTHEGGLRLRVGSRTKGGAPSVGRKALDKIVKRADVQKRMETDERVRILRVVSDMERLRAALSTHLGAPSKDGIINLEVDTQLRGGRIEVNYNPVQMRFSAGKARDADPNKVSNLNVQLHNMPVRTIVTVDGVEREWNIRKQVIADRDDQLLYAFDWSSMEAFIMAWQCGVRVGHWQWLKDLYNGVNLHAQMAALVLPGCPDTKEGAKEFDVDLGGVTKSGYDIGKQSNHGITLGAREAMLNEQYGIPYSLGKAILKRFYNSERGQAVKALHQHIEREAIETGRVTTPFGGYVDFYGFTHDKHDMLRMKDPRKAYAVAQQGTAAILMQACMGPVDGIARECKGRLILTTHDEFLLGAVEDPREGVCAIMNKEWEEMPVEFDGDRGLRIPVEPVMGRSWGEAH